MVAMRNVTAELRALGGRVRRGAGRSPPAIVKCICALLFLVALTGANAQSVEGTVVDSAGAPLAGAVVILERAGQESAGGLRETTDERGRFRFAYVPYGDHVLRVRLIGYRPFTLAVRASRGGVIEKRVALQRMPQLLAGVRIVDQNGCNATSLAGFECRRAAGIGLFRDAGELRAMQPRYWAEMLDGMPGIRRTMTLGPYGPDWKVAAPPGRCIKELWNGQPPMTIDSDAPFKPDEFWKPEDVVAIEYYDSGPKVPSAYRRYFSWDTPLDCGLVIYWLRGAERGMPQ